MNGTNIFVREKRMFGIKKRMCDFYVGGPMRSYPNLNKPMFDLVSHLLREQGFTVWSPAEHKSYLQLSFAQCMTVDLNMVINRCRKIALLPGWRKSLGANMELFAAFACGKDAFEVIPNDDKTSIELKPLDVSSYRLPYQDGEIHRFDPHSCPVDADKPSQQ